MGGGDHWTHTSNLQADRECGAVWPGHPEYVAMDGSVDLKHDRWVVNGEG